MRYLTQDQRDSLYNDGFLIIKNVFSPEEVEHVGKLAHKYCSLNNYAGSPNGDAMSLEGMADFLLDERFVNIAKDILGEEVIYFGDSSLHCKPNRRIYHKDARSDSWDPSTTDYPIYRIGIFFQDHKSHSGGIKFRRGSHKRILLHPNFFRRLISFLPKVFSGKLKLKALFDLGENVNIKSEIGDAVIWNLRTNHSGGAVILKDNPDRVQLPSKDEKVPLNKKLPEHDTRMAIFCAFGAPHKSTEAYIMNKVNEPAYENHWKSANFDNVHVQALANQRGVKLDLRGIAKYRNLKK